MKTEKLLFMAVFVAGLSGGNLVMAQSAAYTKQIITVNSGTYEYAPPFSDFVTIQSYDPLNNTVTPAGTILTQSAQAMTCAGKTAFIAAGDSIVKYDLNTMQPVMAVADSGLCQLAVIDGKLVVSKQYPIVNHFVEVRDTATLGLIAQVSGISGDGGGIVEVNDTVYVAVNGGWAGTSGKLAVINPLDWSLVTEADFGPEAVGISNLYLYAGNVVSVNETPYGVTGTGSITVYNPETRSYNNVIVPHTVGAGAGINGGLLYLILDNGIGSIDLNTLTVAGTAIVPDPGSASYRYILSAAIDTINGRIYANIGDYLTDGHCLVSTLTGDSVTAYSTGISTEVIAVDYRPIPSAIAEGRQTAGFTLYPNPVSDEVNVVTYTSATSCRITITDIAGRTLASSNVALQPAVPVTISCSRLTPGMYYLTTETNGIRAV
ncbi:MAG TPA: T9SS type A sorting domain-containing protein, partial [Bacteroidales bacterium]|nr:T9SS type A sorting domain-containing protein [Bacteroidales bacterium]